MKFAIYSLLALSALPLAAQPSDPQRLAPYVPSPKEIIEQMLESANVKRGEVVVDLGCGDGRILITAVQKFGAKAVGVELNPKLAKEATEMIARLGLQNHAKVIRGDIFEVDLTQADVVTLYLTTNFNERLRPKFEQSLHPGARVVSHDYGIRGWNPIDVQEVFVHNRRHKIYLYQIGPRKK
jgi:ubiquinone/menaquinone biosynthesis C-methylase UbiE